MQVTSTQIAEHRPLKRRRLKFQPPPKREQEEFLGSVEHLDGVKRSQLQAATQAPSEPSPWKTAGQLLSLGVAVAGVALGAAYAPAAHSVTPVEIVAETKIEKALQTSEVQQLLADFPSEFKELLGGFSDTQIRVLGGGINGKTKVSFVTVDNRNAFIKGKAYGRDVWPYVVKTVDRVSARPETFLEQADKQELYDAIVMMSKMTKSQRRGLAQAMDIINSY